MRVIETVLRPDPRTPTNSYPSLFKGLYCPRPYASKIGKTFSVLCERISSPFE